MADFNAVTDTFNRIEVEGVNGHELSDKGIDGPITYLGLRATGSPILFTIAGSQGHSVATSFSRSIQEAVDWTTVLIQDLRKYD